MRRINQNNPLSEIELMKLVPAALADSASKNVSNRYQFLSTRHVIKALESKNLLPFFASQTHSRLKDSETGRHMLRFRDPRVLALQEDAGGLVPEVILQTAHDATSAFRFYFGLFRFVCSNGLVVADSVASMLSVKHVDCSENDVIDAAFEILSHTERVLKSVTAMTKMIPNKEQKESFAAQAFHLRWQDKEHAPDFDPSRLLSARRREDTKDDLFTIYNVVQENLMSGGVRFTLTKSKSFTRTRTRSLKAIDATLKVNQGLWKVTEDLLG